VKIGWGGFLRNTALNAPVQKAVSQSTLLTFEVSRFLQYHLQRLLEKPDNVDRFADLSFIPDVTNDTWLRQCFVGFADATFDDLELSTSYANYVQKRTGHVALPSRDAIPPQSLTIFAQEYATNIGTHIDRLFTIVAKRTYARLLTQRGLPGKEARALATAVITAFDDAAVLGPAYDDFVSECQDVDLRLLLESHLEASRSWRGKLHYIHVQNRWLMTQCSRLTSLIPIYSLDAKYVTIDTDILHSLLGGSRGTGVDKKGFGGRQMCHWALNFRIPSKFVGHDGLGKFFWFYVKTDGVGVSFLVNKWVWVKKTNAEKKKKKQDAVATAVAEADRRRRAAWDALKAVVEASGQDPVVIGADPGRKDLVTIVRDFLDGTKPAAVHFSSARY